MRKVTSLAVLFCLSAINLKAQSPLACIPVHENVSDYSGNNFQSTLVNTDFSEDRFGNENGAVLFDGSGAVHLAVDPFKLNVFTYSVWCKLSSVPSDGGFYCLMSVGGDKADHAIMVGNYSPLGYIGFGFGSITTNMTLNNCYSGVLPQADEWYHLVVNRTNTNLNLYINGELICSKSYTSEPAGYIASSGSTSKFWIGTRHEMNFQSFSGALDEIKVYDQVLTPDQVNSACFAEVGIKESNDVSLKLIYNPNTSTISLPQNIEHYSVFSCSGMKILSGNSHEINTASLAKGMYVVSALVEGKPVSKLVPIY